LIKASTVPESVLNAGDEAVDAFVAGNVLEVRQRG
jgi:hypothetical protein